MLVKHTSSSDTNDAQAQSQPDEGSVRMGSNIDKDDVRQGSGVDKDDVQLGSHVDKANPRVALDTDKDAGDPAQPCPKWASDAGRRVGCCVTPAVHGMDAWRAAVPPLQCDYAGASRVLPNPFVPLLHRAPAASAAELQLVQTNPSHFLKFTLNKCRINRNCDSTPSYQSAEI
ncbi:hypothetical protein K438DRAFT_1784187 [Mycena galopus ATCC 62051]|nr:hypothetical protein K438DRAFT_1784187 [Mycena galopus ATCC 62051]